MTIDVDRRKIYVPVFGGEGSMLWTYHIDQNRMQKIAGDIFGTTDGPLSSAKFFNLLQVAVDDSTAKEDLYGVDTVNVRYIDLDAGQVSTITAINSTYTFASLSNTIRVVSGTMYLFTNQRELRKLNITSREEVLLAGQNSNTEPFALLDGIGTRATFAGPGIFQVNPDCSGNLQMYVGVDSASRAQLNVIRKINLTSLETTTIAGDPTNEFSSLKRDGASSSSLFARPSDLAVDGRRSAAVLYIIDKGASQSIRVLDTSQGVVDTLITSNSEITSFSFLTLDTFSNRTVLYGYGDKKIFRVDNHTLSPTASPSVLTSSPTTIKLNSSGGGGGGSQDSTAAIWSPFVGIAGAAMLAGVVVFFCRNRKRTGRGTIGIDGVKSDETLYGCSEAEKQTHTKQLQSPTSERTTMFAGVPLYQPEDIKIHEKLGDGYFGNVHRVTITAASAGVSDAVIKIPKHVDQLDVDGFKELIAMTRAKPHPNLVALLGLVTLDTKMCMLVEYCEKGALSNLHLSENFTLKRRFLGIARDVCCGLACLHEARIVHRDLACRNLFMKRDGRILIGDYGLAREIKVTDTVYSQPKSSIPWPWYPPEALSKWKIFDFKSDVWSFGISMWEVATKGNMPYKELSDTMDISQIQAQIIEGKLRVEFPANVAVDVPFMKQMVDLCLQKEPKSRPSIANLLKRIVEETQRCGFDGKDVEAVDSKYAVESSRSAVPSGPVSAQPHTVQKNKNLQPNIDFTLGTPSVPYSEQNRALSGYQKCEKVRSNESDGGKAHNPYSQQETRDDSLDEIVINDQRPPKKPGLYSPAVTNAPH